MSIIASKTVDLIPDTQSIRDTRQIPINKVGIKDIVHPVRVLSRSGGAQQTVARLNMYVNLPHNLKGTHMSRFVELLNGYEREVTVHSFKMMLSEMTARLEGDMGYIQMTFPYFIDKAAPVSTVRSLMNYDVTFHGERVGDSSRIWIKVIVPVTSLCPCSKSIASYGAHNQRSHITLDVCTDHLIWIEEIVELAETEAACELYGLLKRPDEKYVTERAYDNPKFVEDVVRDVAVKLNADARILAYRVESENFESIHNHSAYAMVERVSRNEVDVL
jgi:GTP cyclohydrolase I